MTIGTNTLLHQKHSPGDKQQGTLSGAWIQAHVIYVAVISHA